MGLFLDAAEIVLTRIGKPMRTRELTDTAIELGLLEFSNGKTPYQTMKAKLSVNIRMLGSRSRFKRCGKGLFFLRKLDHYGEEYIAHPIQKVIRPTEDVLVFPVELLEKTGSFNGISRNYKPYAKILLNSQKNEFMPRIGAETNQAYKQVLSYVIVKYHDSVLRFVRGTYSSVQAYLKGRYCIGFGGHVQSSDFRKMPLFSYRDSGFKNSVERELNEELQLPSGVITDESLQMIGVLNDDSSDLGKVHFAFIYLLSLDHLKKIPTSKELKREKSINQLMFVPIKELGNEFERYEYWSKLCIKTFFRKQVSIRCWVHPVKSFSLRKHCHNIALVGRIGCGKTEASRLLEKKFKYHVIPTGQIIQEILSCPPITQIGRNKFQDIAFSFIKRPGSIEKLAGTLYQRIINGGTNRHVIDGLRNPETFELLKKNLDGDLTLIYIDSTVDNAYQFFKQREGHGISFKEFLNLVQHPAEQQIEDFVRLANIVFYNHGGKESFLNTIHEFLNRELDEL